MIMYMRSVKLVVNIRVTYLGLVPVRAKFGIVLELLGCLGRISSIVSMISFGIL